MSACLMIGGRRGMDTSGGHHTTLSTFARKKQVCAAAIFTGIMSRWYELCRRAAEVKVVAPWQSVAIGSLAKCPALRG